MSTKPQKTLLFLYKPEERQILLAMKKRGFGEGKLNGVGGKLEAGESVEEAAVRETKEEIGVDIHLNDLRSHGFIDFSFEGKPDWSQRVHIFFVENWSGDPVESEEMSPDWYDIDSIPFQTMWIDDQHWLPRAIEGEILEAMFHFNEDGSEILYMKI